jgi:hypothetical protein
MTLAAIVEGSPLDDLPPLENGLTASEVDVGRRCDASDAYRGGADADRALCGTARSDTRE